MLSAPIEINETRMSFAEESSYLMIDDNLPRYGLTRQFLKRMAVFLTAIAFFALSLYLHEMRSFDEIYGKQLVVTSNQTNVGLMKFTHTKFS